MIPTSFFRLLASGLLLAASTATAAALDLSKPLSGDWRCGGDAPCPISGLFPLLKDIYIYALIVVTFLAFAAILYAVFKVGTSSNQAEKMTEGKGFLTRAAIGLVGIAFLGLLFKEMFAALVDPEINQYFRGVFSRLIETDVLGIATVHAQPAGGQPSHLQNYLTVDGPGDVLVILYQLAMRWVLIPILIANWVWAGFLFVYARGNPDGLKRARARLFFSVVITIIFMVALGILYALRGTFNQIFA